MYGKVAYGEIMAFVIHSKGSLGMPGLNEGRNRWNINLGSLSLSKLEPMGLA